MRVYTRGGYRLTRANEVVRACALPVSRVVTRVDNIVSRISKGGLEREKRACLAVSLSCVDCV